MTLALGVVSIQLTASFQMEAATLQPCNPVVSVKIGDCADFNGEPLENVFRLGTLRLFGDGTVDTIHLFPNPQPRRLPAAKNSFTISGMRMERSNSRQNLHLTAPQDQAMRVLLTTPCDLFAVELSSAFEVEAVVLKARGATVLLRNAPGSAGTPFTLEGVELNPSAGLQSLFVRAIT